MSWIIISRKEVKGLIVVAILSWTILPPYCVQSVGVYNGLTPKETAVTALVNGSQAYLYDMHLENIALSHSAFRSAGSPGANEAADWIAAQFESFGLKVEKEEFSFVNWDLISQPTLVLDDDGDIGTTDDQIGIESFQATHYSWPTPTGGVFADLVVLPLPAAADRSQIGVNPIDTAAWSGVDTAGKVVLIGREVRWDLAWRETYRAKLSVQPPKAIIYTWWYDWMAFVPDYFSSAGGRPLSPDVPGAYYWTLEIPVGFANYDEGLLIRTREASVDVWAKVVIDAVVDVGPHYNVVAKLTGYGGPEQSVIVSGHYDTVMTAGFCDNGAGTAGVLELARVFIDAVDNGVYYPKYTIIFVAFASEEIGLIGSINYVMRHESQMEDIVAVINMDCIGSDYLYATETTPTSGFDLDELVVEAASDLGISAMFLEPGGSDQEVFRNPVVGNNIYSWYWEMNAGLDDATPVESSTMLISYPLVYGDKWNMETPGWIHTSYDNSTSTETLNWVEADDLADHMKVAALTVIRVSPSSLRADLNQDGEVTIQDLFIVAKAFGAEPGDDNWNAVADIDKNSIVNIRDLYEVAKDYGKTV